MADLAKLRRRRASARLKLDAAEISHRGVSEARGLLVKATADLLRAELNRRIAAPLLRAQAAQRETGDLFSQIGA